MNEREKLYQQVTQAVFQVMEDKELISRVQRKPDKLQWLIVLLMGAVLTGIGYQIITNEQNAVNRRDVQMLLDHDKDRVQPWQIDNLNSQQTRMMEQLEELSRKVTELSQRHRQPAVIWGGSIGHAPRLRTH